MSEELIYKVGVEGTKELNKLEKSVDKAGKATNKTTDYFQKMRMELRAARGDMLKYAAGTEEYNRALNKAADIQGRMKATNDIVRASTQDLGDTAKHVTGAMVGFAGGFQVVQSAMSLFGIENEETIKTILKLQQTMAVVQGLSAFAQGIDNMQDILGAFRASNQQLTDELRNTSDGMEGVAKSSGEMGDSMGATAKESAVLSSNLAGNTKIANDVAKSQKGLLSGIESLTKAQIEGQIEYQKGRLSHIETSIALLEEGKGYDALSLKMKEYFTIRKMGNATNEEMIETLKKSQKRHIHAIEIQEEYLDGNNKLSKSQKELAKNTNDASKATKKLGEANETAGKGVSSFAKTIGKSLLTMGAFLAIIAAVSYAISAFIKAINKIPESVKVDIEINENVKKDLAKTRLDIRKFVSDYKKAMKDADNDATDTRVKNIKKVGKETYNLSDQQLQMIIDTEDGWETAFENYLIIAEKTYRAESIMKRRIDTETDMALAQNKAETLFKASSGKDDLSGKAGGFWEGRVSWEELQKRAKEKGWLVKNMNDLFTMGVPQQILDELRKVAIAQEVLDNLPDIDYSGVDFGTGEIKEPTSGSLTPPKEPTDPLARKKPDKVEDDFEIEFLQKRLLAKEELTNEEIAILEEYQRLSNKSADNSYIKYTEHQIRLAKAREKDLSNIEQNLTNELKAKKEKYDKELKLYNEELAIQTDSHNTELEQLRVYNAEKLRIENEFAQMSKDGASNADLEPLRKEYELVTEAIENSKNKIGEYKKEITKIQTDLKQTDLLPEEIKALEEQLDQLNIKIAENGNFLADSLNENMRAMLDTATIYTDQMGQAFQGLSDLTQGFMDAEDNRLAKDKNRLELSQKYREADAEQQAQMMYELEMENYENQKKTFELNKNFEIGAVVATSASNQMDIIANLLDPKNGGYLNPVNIATAAAATIANLATTVGSIAQIKSTSLDEPIPPGMGSNNSIGGGGVSLQPNKTGLTSRDENLNMMNNSNKEDKTENIVKVSDINKVQDNVKVRERNSSY